MKILITGANGFIGASLWREAISKGFEVIAATRANYRLDGLEESYCVGNIDGNTNWGDVLHGCDVVIHLAAQSSSNDTSNEALKNILEINVEGTINLARQAVCAGVKRFIFISSIKVNGENTELGKAFKPSDVPSPVDFYGYSKAQAEILLGKIADAHEMEITIIRPPLTYGRGVKGTFNSLLRLISYGFPLPFGAVTENRRSLLALDNLVDLILVCIDHSKAGNQIFLVCDGEDLSTATLLKKIAGALGKRNHFFPIPVSVLSVITRSLGKSEVAQRLFGSLQIDMSKTTDLLKWKPPISVDQGMAKAVESII